MNEFTKQVLDHGFVTLRNIAGPTRRSSVTFDADDTDPADAARMSFNQTGSETITLKDGTTRPRTRDDDIKLASYLMKNWHTSPFEQLQVWFEVKLPIFVARQFVRHRTARLNEVSGRYVVLPEEWYIPEIVGAKASDKKQGQADTLTLEHQASVKARMQAHAQAGFALYLQLIEEGVAPEHARICLGLGHYTHWLWNQDMHNLMHFLSLRDHSHAQIEAQAYARVKDTLLRQHLPQTMALYDEYRKRH